MTFRNWAVCLKGLRSIPVLSRGNEWGPHSADHYLAFGQGPVSAWNQWSKEWPGILKDRVDKSWHGARAAGGFNPAIPTRLDLGEANVAAGQNSEMVGEFLKSKGLSTDPGQVPLDQQQKVWPEMRTWLSEHYPLRGAIVNNAMNKSTERIPNAGQTYGNLMKKVIGLRDFGRIAGGTTAAVGGGLLGLYGVRRWMEARDARRDAERAKAQQMTLPAAA